MYVLYMLLYSSSVGEMDDPCGRGGTPAAAAAAASGVKYSEWV